MFLACRDQPASASHTHTGDFRLPMGRGLYSEPRLQDSYGNRQDDRQKNAGDPSTPAKFLTPDTGFPLLLPPPIVGALAPPGCPGR